MAKAKRKSCPTCPVDAKTSSGILAEVMAWNDLALRKILLLVAEHARSLADNYQDMGKRTSAQWYYDASRELTRLAGTCPARDPEDDDGRD